MAILIKGMEMPKSCRKCPFRRETYLLTRQLCTVNNDEEICSGIDTVDKSCPLVSVPEHGRLGDLDELKTAFPCGESIRTESVRATIDHIPTIIPASGEGET